MHIKSGLSLRLLFSAAVLLLASFAPTAFVHAQTETTGAFRGRVWDSQTKTPIKGATVQIIYQLSEVPVARQTSDEGVFYVGMLTPGRYTIRVIAPGYQTKEQVQVLLATQTNTILELPPILMDAEKGTGVAQTTQTQTTQTQTQTTQTTQTQTNQTQTTQTTQTQAQANAEAEADVGIQINTTDGRRNGAFTEREVNTLPLGASTLTRTFDELALLLPGVAPPPLTLGSVAGPGIGAGVGSAGQFSVNGLRSRGNNFTVDGSDNNDEDIGVRRQGFFALVPQPIESIQEYQVITLLAPAQYGRNFGAQVNAVSKQGGSRTRGTIYGFFNSSQLNARNAFDTANGNAVTGLTAGNNQPVVLDCPTFLCTGAANIAASQIKVRNLSGGEDSFTLGQGGFVLGGPLEPDRGPNKPGRMFYFISAEGQLLNANKEESFAVPTVEQRGAFGTGATGIFRDPFGARNNAGQLIDPAFAFPTTVDADAIFSLFPFANNPNGVYGRNTFTQALPADAQGKIISGRFDANGKWRSRQQSFTARYNFTDDWRDIPATGAAIFSTLRPNVRTQNFSTFLNSELTNPNSTEPIFNQLRLSYGRTRLVFEEVRDQTFLRSSQLFPNEPFLLNARIRINDTLPDFITGGPNTGPVIYDSGGSVENVLGPVGQVNIAGFSPVGVDVFNFPQRRVNNTYQAADTMTWRIGNHALAFGADTRRTELNSALPRNSRPLITFNGGPELSFAGNTVHFTNRFIRPIDLAGASAASGFFLTFATPGNENAAINLRYYQYNFFGQDEWRVRPNFSLTYGLRYEYNTVPREANQRIESTFNSPLIAQFVPGLTTFLAGRTSIYDADKNNFAPRVGFAWSPSLFGRDRTTVIRGGYGIYYDQILGAVINQSRNVFPNFVTVNLAGGNGTSGFPADPLDLLNPTDPSLILVRNGTINTLDLNTFTFAQQVNFLRFLQNNPTFFQQQNGIGVTIPARTLETPLAHHYSVTFEQQISRDLVLSAAYIGTQGRNLLRFTTPNLGANSVIVPVFGDVQNSAVPQFYGLALPPGSTIDAQGFIRNGRPNKQVGVVNRFETTASSRYDALQVQLRGRFGFLRSSTQFQANYTFSKVTDDVSDVFDMAGAPALPQNSLTFAGERAPANFDVRHRISYDYINDLSKWGKANGFMHFLFNGTQIAGTGFFQTGQPFTVNSIFDVNLDGNLTDRPNTLTGITSTGNRAQPYTAPANAQSLLAPVGTDGAVPRNALRSTNTFLSNVSLIKNFGSSESKRLSLRMDVFNVFNRTNYGIPVRYLEVPWFGRSVDTITPNRRIQFAVKYSF